MVTESPTRRSWRWRRCPNPHRRVVRRASDFWTNYRGAAWDLDGAVIRHCPECDYSGPSHEFTVVRERHAGGQ